MARKHIGNISRIAIYPVKSCAGVELSSARVGATGLEGDREYMIVREAADESGVHRFITQRDKRNREDKPQSLAILAHVEPSLVDDALRLRWNGNDPIEIPRDQGETGELTVSIHSDFASAVDQGEPVARWLSEHLGLRVRLVRARGKFRRFARQNFMPNANQVMFHDAYPIHWITQESLDELSTIAGQAIPWTRFRPNIVGQGGDPRAEHEMLEGVMGEVHFVQAKPCTRCPITTVNQETGERTGTEPLASLATYKRWDRTKEVIFGENILPMCEGTINIGDEITQIAVRNPPLAYVN